MAQLDEQDDRVAAGLTESAFDQFQQELAGRLDKLQDLLQELLACSGQRVMELKLPNNSLPSSAEQDSHRSSQDERSQDSSVPPLTHNVTKPSISSGLDSSLQSSPKPEQKELIDQQMLSPRSGRRRHSLFYSLEEEERARIQQAEIGQDSALSIFSPRSASSRSVLFATPRAKLQQVVKSVQFEMVFATLIVANALLIGLEVQEYVSPSRSVPEVYLISQYFFDFCFLVELMLRLLLSG
eukprot:TRINITY_DN113075_c0_g1_i1.p1 TRINITY_DN113075_c0_g1~~TRINITY_DN113075_c0_g1_i1.p1  ORF type:complete len:240 (+),score=44.02 TRINITY_DN113075_c0_g1_i1:23-742(+)